MNSANYTLSNGVLLPAVGLGTYLMNVDDTIRAVKFALESGYKHIDTAVMNNTDLKSQMQLLLIHFHDDIYTRWYIEMKMGFQKVWIFLH